MKRPNVGTDSVQTRNMLVVSARWLARGAALLVTACTTVGEHARQAPLAEASHAREATPSHAQATRQRFLDMLARSYFPGRSGQLLLVPRVGDFITRTDPDFPYMHGSPWAYDVEIPLIFAGPAVKVGTYSTPAAQQDVAPTLAAALGVHMPPTSTGRELPVLKPGMAPPRVVLLIVLDGMRRDYFDRYATLMPTLTALRRRGAWFAQAQLNILPSNTAVGHSTIATGTDPAVHGITGTNVYDRIGRVRREIFAGAEPGDLMALTLADVWQFATSGRAIIVAQGSIDRAATPLAGHGACQLNGVPVVLASYDPRSGNWSTNPRCYRLPAYLKEVNASALWAGTAEWMHHTFDSPSDVRFSALFPSFEADAMVAMIEQEPVGEDGIADLILLNYKSADFVGHKYGPDSEELRATLGEMDRHLARILGALEKKVGNDYLLAVTADHGMPSEPSSADRRHFAPSIVDLLNNQFDPEGKQLVTAFEAENLQIFIDEARLSKLGLTLPDLANFLRSQPFLFWAFTSDEVRQAAAEH